MLFLLVSPFSRLLEVRMEKLRVHLHAMQSQAMTISDSFALDNLFEDIHWIILIAGHVLCMDSDGETPMIPSEVMQYSINQCTNKQVFKNKYHVLRRSHFTLIQFLGYLRRYFENDGISPTNRC